MAFSPADQHILVTATSGTLDGLDTLWNVTDPARPRRLANFEGGAPTAFAPDGRTVATVAFNGQPALWNVADLAKPARITTLPSGDDSKLWGEAFSPDGRILAAAYTDRLYLWNVTNPARPRLLRTLAAPVAPPLAGPIQPGRHRVLTRRPPAGQHRRPQPARLVERDRPGPRHPHRYRAQ